MKLGPMRHYMKRLLKWIKKKEKQVFLNVVAGTSIGAINAAIIVSYVVENNPWEGSRKTKGLLGVSIKGIII
jgi:NTE family protein